MRLSLILIFVLRPDRLGSLADVAAVVATVGTTASTAVDPVPAIADACARDGAWLHVDAAYAGTAMVCPEFRWAFSGVTAADSVVVNAHKWMLTPMDCSLLWSRRPDALRAAFSLVPEYLRTPDAEDALSLSEYGPALGRRNRALKLWAVLRCHGRAGLQEHVRHGVSLAAEFESWVTLGARLGGLRPAAVFSGLLSRAGRRHCQPGASRRASTPEARSSSPTPCWPVATYCGLPSAT